MAEYRLALDIGTNSLGWCALGLEQRGARFEPVSIIDMGVRIFSDGRDPQSGVSNAVKRRMARGMRRNRDRFVERRKRLLVALTDSGLMPHDVGSKKALVLLDPYELRARGLDTRLEPHELGRAIFHLNQRRGFKSNRKSDSKDKEAGILKQAIREQKVKMAEIGARTFGEFLFLRREQGLSVRSRVLTRTIAEPKTKKKEEDYYDFYPARDEIEAEFEILWKSQATYHPSILTDSARQRIYHCIFDQRPLKPQVVGKCTFERSEDRLARAYPLSQRARIFQELNHLQILDRQTLRSRPLRVEERDKIAVLMCRPNGKKSGVAEVPFDTIRTKLHLNADTTFSLESEKRTKLEGDTTSALMSHKSRFGPRWYDLTHEQQENVIAQLLNESDEEQLLEMLQEDWGLDREHAQAAADTPLPSGYGSLSRSALSKILPELIAEVIPYSEAVVRAGYTSHSQFHQGDALERLPYYGVVLDRHVMLDPEKGGHPAAKLEDRFGKVGNPTVHIALNQLRKVVNEVIKLHGKPREIHVEVLRELKNSLKKKEEISKEQAKNQRENDECVRLLREEYQERVSRENIHRLRLYRELDAADRVCIYTGRTISPKTLFSEEIEIDHILPKSRTLDDSFANKLLCFRGANREKSSRTPFEAWGATGSWVDILARSSMLPRNKSWRFAEDAMARYEKEADFIQRQLTDSQYIASLARGYLASLFSASEVHKVVCLPGRLTGMFRHHLGLSTVLEEVNPSIAESSSSKGEKNRSDHRHHAVDALIVGLMDRAFLQKAASVSARREREGVYGLLENLSEPWSGFRNDARNSLNRIIVSHKLDHGIESELHNQTAYGIAARPDPRGEAVHRVAVLNLKLGNLLQIKGRKLRAYLIAHLAGESVQEVFKLLEQHDDRENTTALDLIDLCGGRFKNGDALLQGAKAFLLEKNVHRVRIVEQITLIKLRDRGGRLYKGFKSDGNAYLDIVQEEGDGVWRGENGNEL